MKKGKRRPRIVEPDPAPLYFPEGRYDTLYGPKSALKFNVDKYDRIKDEPAADPGIIQEEIE